MRDFDPRRRERSPSDDKPSEGEEGEPEGDEFPEDSTGEVVEGEEPAPENPAPDAGSGPEAAPGRPGLNDEQRRLAARLHALMGSQKAAILAPDGSETEVAIMQLPESLMASGGAIGVAFDGIISQRILDIAHARGIKMVAGVRRGQITKAPLDVEVFTAEDLGV
jgi:hypothetical protein